MVMLLLPPPRPRRKAERYLNSHSLQYLEGQHPQKVFSPVRESAFRFRSKLSEGAVRKRGSHGTAAKVTLAENARGALTDN